MYAANSKIVYFIFFCPKVRAQQTGCFNSREGERSGRHSWMGEKEAFDELSVKVHQSTHIFKTHPDASCLLSDSFFSTLLVI